MVMKTAMLVGQPVRPTPRHLPSRPVSTLYKICLKTAWRHDTVLNITSLGWGNQLNPATHVQILLRSIISCWLCCNGRTSGQNASSALKKFHYDLVWAIKHLSACMMVLH